MQERAIRERWPMSQAVRVKVLKRLASIVDPDFVPPDGTPIPGLREVIAASRALISADKLNLEQQKLEQTDERIELERQRLGADYPKDVRTAAEIMTSMQAAAERYEREHGSSSGGDGGMGRGDAGDRGGAGEVPDGPGPVQ